MKTTIDLPDEILRKAKVLAVERRITLEELMIEALQKVTNASVADENKKQTPSMKRLLKAMKAANTEPMQPLKREELYDR